MLSVFMGKLERPVYRVLNTVIYQYINDVFERGIDTLMDQMALRMTNSTGSLINVACHTVIIFCTKHTECYSRGSLSNGDWRVTKLMI